MPASTTTNKRKTPETPTTTRVTDIQLADALEKARTRVLDEFRNTSAGPYMELACKLMAKYAKEEMKL